MDLIMKLDVKLPHPGEYMHLPPQTVEKVKRNFMVRYMSYFIAKTILMARCSCTSTSLPFIFFNCP